MHPVLFELPWGGNANAYGTSILVGALLAMPGIYWDARRRGIAPGNTASFLVDFYLVLVLGAFVGGRLVHVITVPGAYLADPWQVFVSDGTGFVFFGSLGAIVAGWIWVARRYQTRFSMMCDLGATWMALGHGFGRLGCWLAGCCWGAPTAAPIGVRFPPESIVFSTGGAATDDHTTVALHPVQLYEAIGLWAIAAGLVAWRLHRGPEPPWRQASRYAAAYGVLRMITEAFRGDAGRGFAVELRWPALAEALWLPPQQPLALSTSQCAALILLALGLVGLRRSRPTRAPAA